MEDWTLGAPVPLPEGVTLVLGTGCWQCGGQYSTYETFDASGRTVLYEAPEEVHVAAYLEDPAHLYLATCKPNCNGYDGQHEGTTTTLYESETRGESWQSLGEMPAIWSLGPDGHGELLMVTGEAGVLTLFPSGGSVNAPERAVDERRPLFLGGEPVWSTTDQTVVNGEGRVIVDVAGLDRPDANVHHLAPRPGGGFLAGWYGSGEGGIAILDEDGVVAVYVGERFNSPDALWLDEQHFIMGVQYTHEEIAQFDGPDSLTRFRTPTMFDLGTGIMHPIAEFFEPDAPAGRNYITAIWRD